MNERHNRPIRKFNPGTLQSDEEVIEQFVVRKHELDIVLDVLRGNVDSPSCQHVLVVAPRGRGKTMLLARVAAELRADEKFSARLLPVRFMEESQEIFNLADFWLETLFHLARESATHDPELARELRETHTALTARWREQALEEHARAAVLAAADRLGKKLVLMVENLQALCENVNDDFGWKLRGVLQSEPQIMLLATATSRFEGLDDAQEPFFELFRIVDLQRLSTDECRRLWQVVSGDTVSGRDIRPLKILTGGNPRLLVIVAGFARHRSLGHLMEELVNLIDEHTEYFRNHLEVLGKNERRVYVAVIDLWQASRAGEIAARARMDVRTVSTMLGRLVDRGAVIVEGSRKKQLYAAERLYSIYYKLRRDRDEAAIVRAMIHFMAIFYSESEMAEMSGMLMAEAAKSKAIREGIERARAELPKIDSVFSGMAWPGVEGLSNQTSTIDDELVERFGARDAAALQVRVARALVDKGIEQGRSGDFAAAIVAYDEVIERFGRSDVSALQEAVARALVNKGVAEGRLGDHAAALAACDEVIESFDGRDVPGLQEAVARALVNKGVVQEELGDSAAAIVAYDEVIERFGASDTPEIQARVARALVNKGVVQEELGDSAAALATYDEVADRFGASDTPEIQARVARALVNKGVVQEGLGDSAAALATYDEVADRFGASDTPEIQARVARAFVNKGVVQEGLGDSAAALATYDEVADRFGASDTPEIQTRVAWALSKKGDTQRARGEFAAALAAYDEVVERFGASDAPALQAPVAWVLADKGDTQRARGEFAAALAAYDEVVERFGASDAPALQASVAWALSKKGDTQRARGEFAAALAAYDEVIERFGASDAPALQVSVAWALADKGDTQRARGEFAAALAAYDEVVERFGGSDAPALQARVAWALSKKGDTQRARGEFAAALAVYDEVVERFGGRDTPEVQLPVAWALSKKGDTQRARGEFAAALAVYDEVVERFGGRDTPEVQVPVAWALVDKGVTQIEIGRAKEALHTCEELEQRLGLLPGDERLVFEWRAMRVRTKALLVQEKHGAAMDTFRSAYAMFVPGNETMMHEMLRLVPDLIVAGASERDLVEILSSDRAKSDTLLPLVVALRQRVGEAVRAPAEVLEVAADIRERIEAKTAKGSSS